MRKVKVEHPAAFIKEWLEERGLSEDALERMMGCPIKEVLAEKAPVNEDFANRFQRVSLIPAHLLLNHQKRYDSQFKK